VPSLYVTQFAYDFADSIFFVQDLLTAPIFVLPNTTTTPSWSSRIAALDSRYFTGGT